MFTFVPAQGFPGGPMPGPMPWGAPAGGEQWQQPPGGEQWQAAAGGAQWGGMPAPMPHWKGGGGKGKSPGTWCSSDSYFESSLRSGDSAGYTAAGLLLYRTGAEGLEVLLACEKPWNPLANDYDPLAWNPLCGKKTGGAYAEKDAATTVGRTLNEVFGGCVNAPTVAKLEELCRTAPALWYPAGKFALFVSEYKVEEDGDCFDEAATRFGQAKDEGRYPFTPEEKRVNSRGQATQRWVKQIEELEWVPAKDLLVAEPKKPLTDLLRNVCLNGTFLNFLQGGEPPAAPSPQAEQPSKGSKKGKGGGEDGGKDGKKGGGKGKSKGDKGKGFGKAKGMPYASFAPVPPPMSPQMYPVEMQRQMIGEKLYMTVQAMVNSPVIAQKVTGMLLELPMPELMPLLGPSEEDRSLLQQRVDEAIEVLEAEDFAAKGQ